MNPTLKHDCEAVEEQLRQAALDGERYRKAGEALADAIEKNGCGEEGSGCSYCNALITYRQAVEQKEV